MHATLQFASMALLLLMATGCGRTRPAVAPPSVGSAESVAVAPELRDGMACSPKQGGDVVVDSKAIREAAGSSIANRKDGNVVTEDWPAAIRALRPLRVYSDRVNVVIALSRERGVEQGLYVSVPISSYLPCDGDGWRFEPVGEDVWRYTRRVGEP